MARSPMEREFLNQNYANCRNLLEYCIHTNPDSFTPEKAAYDFELLAESSYMLKDYKFTLEIVEKLLPVLQCSNPARLEELHKLASAHAASRVPVECADDRLRHIIERFTHVFHNIVKPIKVYVPKDKEDYTQFFQKTFPNRPVNKYDDLLACGFYYDPHALWLVYKPEHIAENIPDLALEGLTAHELAHFDQYSIELIRLVPDTHHIIDDSINQRWTDRHAILKGLAWPLYCSRQHYGASTQVFSANDIMAYIKSLY